MTYDTIIIGGGLSGLSAAVELSSRGHKILLLEHRKFLGGRTYSFVDETTGDVVDNGQHLMMGCYHETRRYLKTIGTEHLAHLQPNLHIDFLNPKNGFAALSCPPLPAPFHLLGGMLGLRTLRFVDRLKLVRVGLELQKSPATVEPKIASMTVDEWMTNLGQPEENKKYLWDIIAIGSLNDDPKTVSALLFYRVLRSAFLGKRENSSLLIPRAGLSQLLVEPAVAFLKSKGSEVRISAGVGRIEVSGIQVTGIRLHGEFVTARAYISAVPYFALVALLPNREIVPALDRFESSPIITINLWFDRTVMEQEFAALLDSSVQWVFNKTKMYGKQSDGRQNLSLVISGASEYVEMEKERLVAVALEDLHRVLPRTRAARVVHSLVVKEKRATFSPKPGIEQFRPSAATPLSNFFLAGDWTNTGFPATIEGAVMSGSKGAGKVAEFMGPKSITSG